MLNFIGLILIHLAPLLLLAIPFLLFFDITLKSRKNQLNSLENNIAKPDITELEYKLNKLIKQNQELTKTNILQENLKKTPSSTISGYLRLDKKALKGFHLFQLIFTLIKNQAEDIKIIKILHHYLPSCSTSHLYAILNSFKVFLNISQKDGKQKELLKDLNQNKILTTLLYLEKKLNTTLNEINKAPPAMQQLIIDRAMVYGLIFASFSEFYNTKATEKILRLSNMLSPELFKYWHQIPKNLYKNKTFKTPPNIENKKNTIF